jgi:hypothetical protein
MTNLPARLRHLPESPRIALSAASLITGLCVLAACGVGTSSRAAAPRGRPLIGLTSATFISAATGWLVGVQDCGRPVCAIQLRRTTDGRRCWPAR